jgi:hypothetical protein
MSLALASAGAIAHADELNAVDLTGEVSNASAQVLDVSGAELPDDVSSDLFQPAVAENDGGETVIDVGALDLSALEALGLELGPLDLLGADGLLDLGALNQYAEAAGDGSSHAAAGAVSDLGVIDIPVDAVPAESGAGITISSESLGLGELVALSVEAAAIASTATWPAGGEPEGDYVVADLTVRVGGSLPVDETTAMVEELETATAPVDDALGVLGGLLGVDTDIEVPDPLEDGALVISLDDLLATLGVESINDLPPGTDLLEHLVQAVITLLTETADDVVDQVRAAVDDLTGSPEFDTVCNPPLLPPNPACGIVDTAVDTVDTAATDAVDSATSALAEPLAEATSGLLALPVGSESVNDAGSFSKTALSAVIGPDGEIGRVDLATSTVGPNSTP